jgi:uroporphyrinogen-III synthase
MRMPELVAKSGFQGVRVLSLESRRAKEMALLIANNGGHATVAPSTREVPAEDHGDVKRFVSALRAGQIDILIFMTGVGMRALAQAAESLCTREEFVFALSKTTVVARGPKPVAALREFGVAIAATVPEPNTWRELLQTLDEKKEAIPLGGRSVAVQEHGEPSPELIRGLIDRGANVTTVRVYEWSLPEDLGPLRAAAQAVAGGEIEVLLVTSAVQIRHLLQVAEEMGIRDKVVGGLSRVVVGSIGPLASAALRELGIQVDLEPSHPKMGFLVKEVADKSAELLQGKRG